MGTRGHRNTGPSVTVSGSCKVLTPLARYCSLSRAPLDPQQGTRFYWYQ